MQVQITSFTGLWKGITTHLYLEHHMKLWLRMEVDAIKHHFPYFNQQDALITTEWLIKHFILGTKSYMLQHQGAILIGFIKKKDCNSNTYLVLIAPTFVRFR